MEYGSTQFNVTEMTWTFRHSFSTSRTLEIPINRSQSRITQSANFLYIPSNDSPVNSLINEEEEEEGENVRVDCFLLQTSLDILLCILKSL